MASVPSQNKSKHHDWYVSVREYLLHVEAHRADKTLRFYKVQLTQLVKWAEANSVGIDAFTKRHMDRYLAERAKTVGKTTLHHDGVAAKAFFKWAVRNELVDRDPLATYEVSKAPKPPMYMPTDADVAALLTAVGDYWNAAKNPRVGAHSPERRTFHRDRNFALLLLLLDTACRVGEALALKVDDYRANERQILIRESKGREPRVLPLSVETVEVLEVWLRRRVRLMRDVSDEGYLFVSEFGGVIEPGRVLKAMKGYLRFAGLPDAIGLHSLRRFSLNKLAKNNLLGAQAIAGHKNPTTTLRYTKIDADFVRDFHGEVGVIKGIFTARREKRKRII